MLKLLLYCTKSKPYLLQGFAKPFHTKDKNNPFNYSWSLTDKQTSNTLNGKIIGECDYEIEEIDSCPNYEDNERFYLTHNCIYFNLLNESCLNETQLEDYLKGKKGYAIHIKNLHIFDTPRELSDYYIPKHPYKPITKAPQNMMYCRKVVKTDVKLGDKVFKNAAYQINHYVLASIRPKWLCKILNGEKTIEVRKKVLKEML